MYGANYIFMSAYDGTMLVQPFEPHKELTSQWDLVDEHGSYSSANWSARPEADPSGDS